MAHSPVYSGFVLLSAGPIGDHMVCLDVANHFLTATGKPVSVIVKHPNPFLAELGEGYSKKINQIPFTTRRGKFLLLKLLLKSIVQPYCYILFFPIPAPGYLKVFATCIRFATRSRVVGLHLEGTRSFPEGQGYGRWLGMNNTILMKPEGFTETANRLLVWLGYKSIEWIPQLPFTEDDSVFSKMHIKGNKYIVMHLNSSGFFRSLPADRWNIIIRALLVKTDLPIVFSGSKGDSSFIESCIKDIASDRLINVSGLTTTRELLTLYKNAAVCVTVQTGNGLIINMLHVPTVVVNIKGTSMFDYSFNRYATNLYSSQDCTCNVFETECTLLPYKGKFYMACLFNLHEEEIVDAITAKIHERKN
jgi:hypothetical protein